MRLIDAHDLWTEIMMLPHNGDMISSEEVEKAIAEAPAVEAVPVVHGRWLSWKELLPNQFSLLRFVKKKGFCSNCGAFERKDRFCPFCGAKMDGGENNV